jgi:hypothetical protein
MIIAIRSSIRPKPWSARSRFRTLLISAQAATVFIRR